MAKIRVILLTRIDGLDVGATAEYWSEDVPGLVAVGAVERIDEGDAEKAEPAAAKNKAAPPAPQTKAAE